MDLRAAAAVLATSAGLVHDQLGNYALAWYVAGGLRPAEDRP